MEIFVVLELLPDQGGADHLAVHLDQAALRLRGEDCAGNSSHRERIGQTGDGGEHQQQDDGGANFSEHVFLLFLRHCERSEAIQNLSAEAVWIASSLRSSQ